jgi:hypothetical protein
MLAALVGWPQGAFASQLTFKDGGSVEVEREIDGGLVRVRGRGRVRVRVRVGLRVRLRARVGLGGARDRRWPRDARSPEP